MLRVLLLFSAVASASQDARLTDLALPHYAAPYYLLRDVGIETVVATPRGGYPPIGQPRADAPADAAAERFRRDRAARDELGDSLALDQICADDFDALYVAGGHGALWDLATAPYAGLLVARLVLTERPVALVGHAAAALRGAVDDGGLPLVRGRRLTTVPSAVEVAAGIDGLLPFLPQDELVRLGATYVVPDAGSHVVRDGPLITGQHADTAGAVAQALIDALRPP